MTDNSFLPDCFSVFNTLFIHPIVYLPHPRSTSTPVIGWKRQRPKMASTWTALRLPITWTLKTLSRISGRSSSTPRLGNSHWVMNLTCCVICEVFALLFCRFFSLRCPRLGYGKGVPLPVWKLPGPQAQERGCVHQGADRQLGQNVSVTLSLDPN